MNKEAQSLSNDDELQQIELERLELIRRIAKRDQQAMVELYDGMNRLIFGLALRVLNDPSLAEEVVIDVFSQIWRKVDSYDTHRGTPSAWILMMTRSRAIDRLRSGNQDRRRLEPLETVEYSVSNNDSPEESAAELERRRIVQQALGTLPDEQREVIELAYYGGYSHREISEVLSLPLGTVKTRTRLGLIRLKDALAGLKEEL